MAEGNGWTGWPIVLETEVNLYKQIVLINLYNRPLFCINTGPRRKLKEGTETKQPTYGI